MLTSVVLLTFVLNNNTLFSIPTQKTSEKAPTINELHKLIKSSNENLDKISSVLEFTAQAINKGSLVLPNKQVVKKWIKNNQAVIKTLEDSLNDFEIDRTKIFKVNCISKFLIAHINEQLTNQLRNVQTFKLDADQPLAIIKSPSYQITSKTIQQLIVSNEKHVLVLQKKANEIGLTPVNKTTRKMEELNDKYQVTKVLSIVPPLLLVGLAILYYSPLKWYGIELIQQGTNDEKISTTKAENWWSWLRTIKRDVCGGSKTIDYPIHEYNRSHGNSNGFLHTLLTIWEKDSKKINLAVTALIAYANKDSLANTFPQIGQFMSGLRDFWQRLKGYDIQTPGRYEIIENLTLDDERIIGLDDQKNDLQHTLEYIANPDMYDKQNSGPGKAMIIVGPSGNGKTLLAKALAGSLNQLLKKKGSNNRIAFKEIKWTEVAWTREGLKKVVEQAKPHAPCILFFDEIHTLPLQTKEGSPTLSDLLTELDGVNAANSSSNQIIFVAATNQPEMLDAALLRPGRFGTIIRVQKPNFETRKQYFEVMCRRHSIDTSAIDFDLLSRQTAGCSFSHLDSLLKDARFTARSEIRRTNQQYIQDCIIKSIYRLKDDSILSEFEKKHLAANKAGGAVMHLLLKPQEQIEIVTIKGRWKKIKESRYWDNEARKKVNIAPNIKYGGIFTYNPNEALEIIDENEKINQCKIKIASYLAEEILLKARSFKVSNKYAKATHPKSKQKALELVRSMLYELYEEEFMSETMKQDLKDKTYATFKRYEEEVKKLLIENNALLAIIAKDLQEKELLTASDLTELISKV